MAFDTLVADNTDYITRENLHKALCGTDQEEVKVSKNDSECNQDHVIWNDITAELSDKDRINKEEFFHIMRSVMDKEKERIKHKSANMDWFPVSNKYISNI